MIKEKLNGILNKIKNNKKKVIGVTAIVFAVFIFTFTVYNLNNPTKFNRLFASIGSVPNENFNDTNFYTCVVDTYNSANGTSKAYTDNLTDEELASLTSLNCIDKSIKDASGIEKLTGLTRLYLDNNLFTNIDLTNNTLLEKLSISNEKVDNQLTNIDISNNTLLKDLDLSCNNLSIIDLSNNTLLKVLDLSWNNLSTLDLSHNTSLIELNLRENQLTSIDISKNTALIYLNLGNNKLINIDLNNNAVLSELYLYDNQLTSVSLNNNIELTDISLNDNQLTNIDLSKNINLNFLELYNNMLTDINLASNSVLEDLNLENNKLQSVDIKNNTLLTYLYLSNNDLTNIDLTNNLKLEELSLENTKIENLNLSKNTALTSLYIDDTPLKEDIFMKVGETYQIEEKIIPPEGQGFTYSIVNTSIATIEGNTITAKKEGSTILKATIGNTSFERKVLIVDNIKLTALKDYIKIDSDKKYILMYEYIDIGDEINQGGYIKSNIGKLRINGDMMQIILGSKVLDEYKMIYFKSSTIIDNDYLFVSASVNDSNPIKCVNCTYQLSDDGKKINIKYDNNIIDKKKIIYMFLPEKGRYYDPIKTVDIYIFGDKIFDEKDIKEINDISEIEKEKINFLNASPKIKKEEYNNSIELYYNGNKIVNYLDLVNFYSNNYDLSNNYIYLGLYDFINDIEGKSPEVELSNEDNMFKITEKTFEIWFTDEECDNDGNCTYPQTGKLNSWDLIKVSSDKYDMSGDTINLGNEDIDLTKINVTNATLKKEDNKLLIMYGDEVVKEFKLEGGKKTTTTTKKNDEKPTATKDKTTTKKEVKATKKKVSIIDKIFGNKETTTVKKEETTTKKNIFRKSTTTKVENSSGNATSNNKNSFKKLVTGSNLLILFLSITGIALIIYIIIDKKKNKFNN